MLEWIAFIFGVAQVLLALKNKTINFYAGIISVCIYSFVFYQAGLFAESILNIYYFFTSIMGIFYWQQKENTHPISFSTKKDYTIALFYFFILFIILTWILKKYTTSTVPYLDATVTSIAWVGTWLMIKRKVENWIILNISNAIAIPLQIYKGLELTSLLTCIYFVIAIKAYFHWKGIATKNKS